MCHFCVASFFSCVNLIEPSIIWTHRTQHSVKFTYGRILLTQIVRNQILATNGNGTIKVANFNLRLYLFAFFQGRQRRD